MLSRGDADSRPLRQAPLRLRRQPEPHGAHDDRSLVEPKFTRWRAGGIEIGPVVP